MPYFVISGKSDCPQFRHAIYVAQYLKDKLPQFDFKEIAKSDDKWEAYVIKLMTTENWHTLTSPLIWKEINEWGSRKYLVGGLSEFWEYVYCYYGLESLIPQEDLKMLAEDSMMHIDMGKSGKASLNDSMVITVVYCADWDITILVTEMLKLNFVRPNIKIRLFDYFSRNMKATLATGCADFINDQMLFSNKEIVTVAITDKEAFNGCDLVIAMYQYKREKHDSVKSWLLTGQDDVFRLADSINYFCKPSLKLVLSNVGPDCFMAELFAQLCPNLIPNNIVVVTSNLGLSAIDAVSKYTGVPVHQINAPPVWGYVEVNSFIDLRNTVFKADIYRPYERALTAPKVATLPLGIVKTELRSMAYFFDDEAAEKILAEVKCNQFMGEFLLRRPFLLANVRSLLSLLDLWIRYDYDYGDEVISLGVVSNGTFGIPPGRFFSQPVKLNEDGVWIPYKDFKFMNDTTRKKISQCLEEASEICEEFML